MTTIERPCDYYPFCHQFEQVDRAIENLVKSGQLYNQQHQTTSHGHNNNNNYGRYQQPNGVQPRYKKSPQQYYYDKGMTQQPQQPQQQPQQQYVHRKNYYYSPQLGSHQGPSNNVPHVSLSSPAAPIPVSQPPQSIQIPAHAHAAPQTYRSQSYSSFQSHSRLGSVGSVGSMTTSPALVATTSMTPVLQPSSGPYTKVQRSRDVASDFDEVDSAIKGLGDMSLELDGEDREEEDFAKSFDKKPTFESSATSSPISFTFDPFAGLGISSKEGGSSVSASDDKQTSPPSVFAPIGTKPDPLASSQRPWPKKSALGMSTTTVWG